MSQLRKGSSSGETGKGARPKQRNGNSKAVGLATAQAPPMPWCCAACDNALEENEHAIECHMCKRWSHKTCTELSDAEFRVLERGGENLLWQCTNCVKAGVPANEQASRTEVKLDMIIRMFEHMLNRLDKLEQSNTGTNLAIDNKIEEAVDKKVTDIMQENRDRDERKLNIIIANLPESEAGSHEDKKQDDKNRVRQLVAKICDVAGGDIDNPARLGPIYIGRNARPRLLKMTVKSAEAKEQIMRNVYSLNAGIDFENRVYINNDSTPREREMYRKLKTEMARRLDEGERDLVIRNLQIVKRRNAGAAGQTREGR